MSAQVSEKLIYEGNETRMNFCPPIPQHPRITKYTKEEITNMTKSKDLPRNIFSTACWRKYIGTWEIKEGRFYLVDLIGRLKLNGEQPLFADWFTGVLRIPQGDLLLRVHMGFGSVYEEELHIKIENGVVVKTKILDNRGKEHNKFGIGWFNLPGNENHFPGEDEW